MKTQASTVKRAQPANNHRADTDQLLTANLAAEFLGVAAATLANWRCSGRYPIPFLKVGRSVRYRKSDLEAWVATRTFTPVDPLVTYEDHFNGGI